LTKSCPEMHIWLRS
jgi:hypothetical protein